MTGYFVIKQNREDQRKRTGANALVTAALLEYGTDDPQILVLHLVHGGKIEGFPTTKLIKALQILGYDSPYWH